MATSTETSNQHTYAAHLREEVLDLESSDPDCMRKLLNILDNALGELDRQGRLLEIADKTAQTAAHATSCLLNGTRPD